MSKFDEKFKPVYDTDGKTISHYIEREQIKPMSLIKKDGLTVAWQQRDYKNVTTNFE